MTEHHCAIIEGAIIEYTPAQVSHIWASLKRTVKAGCYRCPFCGKEYPRGKTKQASYRAWERFSKDVMQHFACRCGFTTGNTLHFGAHLQLCVIVVKSNDGEPMKFDQGLLTQKTMLTARHVSGGVSTVTVTDVKPAGKDFEFSDVAIEIKHQTGEFVIPCKERGEDFRLLLKEWGLDSAKWIGKKLNLSTEEYTSAKNQTSQIVRFEAA